MRGWNFLLLFSRSVCNAATMCVLTFVGTMNNYWRSFQLWKMPATQIKSSEICFRFKIVLSSFYGSKFAWNWINVASFQPRTIVSFFSQYCVRHRASICQCNDGNPCQLMKNFYINIEAHNMDGEVVGKLLVIALLLWFH